jgi:hypothetical protein
MCEVPNWSIRNKKGIDWCICASVCVCKCENASVNSYVDELKHVNEKCVL